MTEQNNQKFSHIAIIGAPNAGKSTLLNHLVGSKVSIISPKVQTTRNVINGICMYENAQLVFIDTPGIFSPNGKLEKAIVKVAWRGLSQADQIALIIDSKKGICTNTKNILEELSKRGEKIIIILNKIDIIPYNILLTYIDILKTYEIIKEIFMISALKGDGTETLKKYFQENALNSPWMYDPEEITDLPSKFLACELVREQLFLNLDKELPYNIAVECEAWEEFNNGSIKIHQAIYVTKENQKKIVIGNKGSLIKKIGQTAKAELEELFDRKIHLFLFVKVRENWMDNPNMLPK